MSVPFAPYVDVIMSDGVAIVVVPGADISKDRQD